MVRGTAAVAITLPLALLVPAAAAAAPVIEPLKPCYVTAKTKEGRESEGVQIAASGFTPNAEVDLSLDGKPFDDGEGLKANSVGELPIPPVPAPFVKKGSRRFTITLTEQGNPANTVSATAMSTALGVKIRPAEARPSQKVRFKGLGFTDPLPIYAHYLYKGELRKTVRMARKPRECGGFEARRRQIPVKRPRLGLWTIQIDQSKDYLDPNLTPHVYVRVAIRLRLRPAQR